MAGGGRAGRRVPATPADRARGGHGAELLHVHAAGGGGLAGRPADRRGRRGGQRQRRRRRAGDLPGGDG
eukprot:9484876-Pyramimonas_sp.AAC.1